MDESDLKFGGEKLFVWALIFLGAIVAILTGFMIGTYAVPIFIVILAIALSITWIAGARERWSRGTGEGRWKCEDDQGTVREAHVQG